MAGRKRDDLASIKRMLREALDLLHDADQKVNHLIRQIREYHRISGNHLQDE